MKKNTYPGKFFVFEGLDGSGKSTQTKLLINRLRKQNYEVETIDFPQHSESSSWFVDQYLNGKYGTAEQVGPYCASIFYACDRYDASFQMREWLKQGKIIICDRYLASNIGHQGGKIEDKEARKEYFGWLYHLEYEIFGIPRPDYTFILKTSPAFSLKLAHKITDEEKKARRKAYLGEKKRDIHEEDKGHQEGTLKSYLHAAEVFPKEFRVIECVENGNLLSPEIIHQKIWAIIREKF